MKKRGTWPSQRCTRRTGRDKKGTHEAALAVAGPMVGPVWSASMAKGADEHPFRCVKAVVAAGARLFRPDRFMKARDAPSDRPVASVPVCRFVLSKALRLG